MGIHYTAADGPAEWRTIDPIGPVTAGEQGYLLTTREGSDRTYRQSRIRGAEVLGRPLPDDPPRE